MTQSNHTFLDLYASAPDTIRGQEPRIREHMPAIRDNNTGKEIAVLTANGRSNDEMAALARTFAAAPELLRALDDLVQWHEFNGHRDDVLKFAREAIARAKGES